MNPWKSVALIEVIKFIPNSLHVHILQFDSYTELYVYLLVNYTRQWLSAECCLENSVLLKLELHRIWLWFCYRSIEVHQYTAVTEQTLVDQVKLTLAIHTDEASWWLISYWSTISIDVIHPINLFTSNHENTMHGASHIRIFIADRE